MITFLTFLRSALRSTFSSSPLYSAAIVAVARFPGILFAAAKANSPRHCACGPEARVGLTAGSRLLAAEQATLEYFRRPGSVR